MTPVGLVKYLNAIPLTDALSNHLVGHQFDLHIDVPSRLADDMKDGLLDMALIPAIEYARLHEPCSIIPDICIGAKGPAASVLLFFNKGVKNLKKVALDTSSRTSVALTKLLLKEKFGETPEYIPMAPDLSQMLSVTDAALIIGDKALEYGVQNHNFIDLAEEWFEWTGLPFVFAFWAGKTDQFSSSDLQMFFESKELGLKNIEIIARKYSQNNPGDIDFYKKYLTENIQYNLDDNYLEGLNSFLEMAFYHSLIENIPPLKLFELSDNPSLNPRALFTGKK